MANKGQFHPDVQFQAVLGDATLFVTADGLTLVRNPAESAIHGNDMDHGPDNGGPDKFGPAPSVLRLRFDGANPAAELVPGPRLPGVAHYLRGNDRGDWVTQVPTYSGVVYRELYPGISLRLDGSPEGIAQTFDVAAGADIGAVRWQYRDADGSRWAGPLPPAPSPKKAGGEGVLGSHGLLWWSSDLWNGVANSVSSTSDKVGESDSPDRLTATPTLIYSTYLGGRVNEMARGLAVDAEGFAYVAGTTTSVDYPVLGALQPEIGNGGSLQDVFVSKLNPEGTALVYSTYFGGVRQEEAYGLAIDRVGRAHITGYTTSENFPTEKPLQPEVHLSDSAFSGDAFITKLKPDGSGLEFSTPWGGTSRDIGKGIAVDAAGFVYITGWTGSNFPAVNAIHPLNRGVRDAFLVKVTPEGDRVIYSTHLGGSFGDDAKRIAVDGAGNAYIVGTTESLNFQVVAPYQRVIAGDFDAFVAKINADGSAFDYATYLGGRGNERGIDIAVNPAGEAYILGYTDSPNLPRVDALQNSRSGPSDLFITRLTAAGDALRFSTYFGGNGDEADCVAGETPRQFATPTPDPRGIRYLAGSRFTDGPVGGIAVDGAGRIHVTSCTSSSNVALVNPIQRTRPGAYGILLSVLDPGGSALLFSTYLGGRSMNVPLALAVGGDGGIFIAGQTDSTDFPLAPAGAPLDGTRGGTDDAFVLKIGAALDDAPTVTPVATVATEVPATEEATPTPTGEATPMSTATEIMPSATSTPTQSTQTPTVEGTPTVQRTPTVRPTNTVRASETATAVVTGTAETREWLVWLPVAYWE